jgi:hypothetical protein
MNLILAMQQKDQLSKEEKNIKNVYKQVGYVGY